MTIGLVIIAFGTTLLWGGSLNPSDPPASTMKTLNQLEPRTAVQTLSGSSLSTYVISQPGSYYLTNNFASGFNKHGLEIASDNVSVDLCGFMISPGLIFGQIRHGIYMSGRKNVEIRNGTIRNFPGCGIVDDSADGRGHRVESVRVQENQNRGIYLNGKGHRVVGCTARSNGGEGIWAGYPSFIQDNHIEDNQDNMFLVRPGLFYYRYYAENTQMHIEAFYVAQYETTNAQYCEFLNNYDPYGEYLNSNMEIDPNGAVGQYIYTVHSGKENHPVNYVSFYNATAYVNWYSRVTGQKYRLPTSPQWQKAASFDPAEMKKYIYGFHRDSIDSTWCNYDNAYGGTLPVGYFDGTGDKNNAVNFYGCYDMSGNVNEWTTTLHSTDNYIIGGGGYTSDATACQANTISYAYFAATSSSMGFRVVRDVD